MKFSEFHIVSDETKPGVRVRLNAFSIHNPFSGLLEGLPTREMALHSVERYIKKMHGERKTLWLNQPSPVAFYAAIMFLDSMFTTNDSDDGTEMVAVMFVDGIDLEAPSKMIEELNKHDWREISQGFEF